MDSKTYELISVQGSFDTEEKELEAKEKEMLADGYKIDVNFSTAHYYHKEFIRELPAAKDKAEVLTDEVKRLRNPFMELTGNDSGSVFASSSAGFEECRQKVLNLLNRPA